MLPTVSQTVVYMRDFNNRDIYSYMNMTMLNNYEGVLVLIMVIG